MTTPIRVIIADDHAVLRAGLKLLVNSQADMDVVSEAADGLEAVACARALCPDILLLDLALPGMRGLDVLRAVTRDCPRVRVLVLTMHEEEHYLRQALEAGAAGYVPKSAADAELLSAIRAVARGNVYIHPSHTKILLESLLPRPGVAQAQLSERERAVVRLVALGHTNRQIAEQLFLSVKTVETYRARAMEKLGIRSRAALVRYAIETGLLHE